MAVAKTSRRAVGAEEFDRVADTVGHEGKTGCLGGGLNICGKGRPRGEVRRGFDIKSAVELRFPTQRDGLIAAGDEQHFIRRVERIVEHHQHW